MPRTGFAEARSAAKRTGLWVVGISAEVATPRTLKILISQTWFLTGWCQISSGRAIMQCPLVSLMGWGLVDCDPGLTRERRCSCQRRLGSIHGAGIKAPDQYPSFRLGGPDHSRHFSHGVRCGRLRPAASHMPIPKIFGPDREIYLVSLFRK